MELHNFWHERNREYTREYLQETSILEILQFWKKVDLLSRQKYGKQFYIDDEDFRVWTISKPEILHDIDIPYFIQDLLDLQSYKLTFWGKFKRKPRFALNEKLVCVFEGTEEFRIVSFLDTQDLEVIGTKIENLHINKDFFNDEFEDGVIKSAVIKKGNCLFIPAFSWFQS
jgi:hypothetical protein